MPAKKKLFFVIPNLSHHGGAERVTFNILNSLEPNDYDISLVVFEREGGLLSQLKNSIKIINLNCKRIRYFPFLFIPLILKKKPNLVFFCWGELGAFMSPFVRFFS